MIVNVNYWVNFRVDVDEIVFHDIMDDDKITFREKGTAIDLLAATHDERIFKVMSLVDNAEITGAYDKNGIEAYWEN